MGLGVPEIPPNTVSVVNATQLIAQMFRLVGHVGALVLYRFCSLAKGHGFSVEAF